jgi:hypothetical protein
MDLQKLKDIQEWQVNQVKQMQLVQQNLAKLAHNITTRARENTSLKATVE